MTVRLGPVIADRRVPTRGVDLLALAFGAIAFIVGVPLGAGSAGEAGPSAAPPMGSASPTPSAASSTLSTSAVDRGLEIAITLEGRVAP